MNDQEMPSGAARAPGSRAVPVLDVGGTHVTSAFVRGGDVVEQHRGDLDSSGSRDEILGQIVEVAHQLSDVDVDATWGIAMPGPFRYAEGIGDFRGVDKFAALRDVDVGSALREQLPGAPRTVRFLNDADAYALGEWAAHDRPARFMCITLGTGVGSGFIAHGAPVIDGTTVPFDGALHTELWNGKPLEDTVSRRAIRRDYRMLTDRDDDVAEIAERARRGDDVALGVLGRAMEVLGTVVGTWVDRFAADMVVIGGSMSRSWDVLGPPLEAALDAASERHPTRGPAVLVDTAPLLGAATFVAEV